MTSTNCVFCRLIRGEVPVSLVSETDDALAFMDINQPTPGHVLVIPRVHVRDIYELDANDAAAVFDLTVRVARAVRTGLQADGINLLQSNGSAAGQEVLHFHMHVIARYLGDRDRVHWGWQRNLPPGEELDRLAVRIRSALGSQSTPGGT